ncbi:FMN-binding protein [Algoriphagus kandeliae]|uniref:Ion-translocating oxidoreductase complex subunit G n=1 Tax=Algoriphagus kandeliae TaxID=2562278 RepID=A0A4Y9QV91_9BACT|nr:FMN-binding protein [Algoriphagus kandeliae]TFV95668.1 FMN-binding protein [Algoriphagus kandeliae]
MTDSKTIAPPSNSFKMLRAMAGIGIICGILIVFTYEGTLPRIEFLRAEALKEAIFKVLPGITEMQPYAYKNNSFLPAEETDTDVVYAGYDSEGNFKGIAIVASGQGYADQIKIIYGYDPDNQKVVGFYVLESKETPGLGDKIEKDPTFLENFTALDVALNDDQSTLQNRVVTVKKGTKTNAWEVDGISGATISSRAIGEIINASASEWAPLIYKNKTAFNSLENE